MANKKWIVCREFFEDEHKRAMGMIPATQLHFVPTKTEDCSNRSLLKRMNFSSGKIKIKFAKKTDGVVILVVMCRVLLKRVLRRLNT